MRFILYWHKKAAILIALALATGMNKLAAHTDPEYIPIHPAGQKLLSIQLAALPGSIRQDSTSFILPFSRAGNLILIQARADDIEGNFILDTGCPHLVLNLTYFRHYSITYDHGAERAGATGSIASLEQVQINSFSFGSVNFSRMDVDLVNLGHIENNKGIKVLGLLGMRMLDQFEMIIDYEKSQIHFRKLTRKEAASYRHEMLNDTSAYYTIPFELKDDRIIIRTELSGKKLRFIMDSGAESNIIDSRLPDRVFENVSITGRVLMAGAGNRKIEALQGDLKTLQLGSQRIENIPVIVTNLEKTCFSYGGCVDGILGFDFLSLQKIGFNFVTRKMYIWK